MIAGMVRRIGFYIVDFLNGGNCRAHLKDIKKKSVGYDSTEQLTSILNYAINNVPYYANVANPDIMEFPVINKITIKENFEKFLSKEYTDLTKLHRIQTSGSTGVPMVAYQDHNKRDRVKMDLIYAHTKIGWNLGDHYVFIRHWVDNYKQPKIQHFLQNCHPVNVATFNDLEKKNLITHLKKHKGSVVFGYSSSIIDFAKYLEKNGLNGAVLNIKIIVCDSDELSDANKKFISNIFNCGVINRYDNEENGLLAMSEIENNILQVNNASVYIELLEEYSDNRVQPGKIGRVIVTDLYNKAMPLIRYDTGDLAISNDTGSISTIRELAGRKSDAIYSTSGNLISSVAISGLTEAFSNINRYQLIQTTSHTYCFRYTGLFDKNDLTELEQRLHKCLGNDSVVQFENLEVIESGKNGKFKTLVGMH